MPLAQLKRLLLLEVENASSSDTVKRFQAILVDAILQIQLLDDGQLAIADETISTELTQTSVSATELPSADPVQEWKRREAERIEKIFHHAGVSSEKARFAANFDVVKDSDKYATLFSYWREVAEKTGEVYRNHLIICYQDSGGWSFDLHSPNGILHDGDFCGYPTRSKARLEARRELLVYLTTGSLLKAVGELEKQGKISGVEHDALEDSIYAFSLSFRS